MLMILRPWNSITCSSLANKYFCFTLIITSAVCFRFASVPFPPPLPPVLPVLSHPPSSVMGHFLVTKNSLSINITANVTTMLKWVKVLCC